MPIEFWTSPTLDLVYARWWGTIDLSDFRAHYVTYLGDAHYRPGRSELINMSDVHSLDFDFEQTRLVLRQVTAPENPAGQVTTHSVIWAPGDDAFATCRMMQQLSADHAALDVVLVRDEREALTAAGLSHKSCAELMATETFLPAKLRS